MASIACPACQLQLEITPAMAGQEMACPSCHARFVAADGGPLMPPLFMPPTAAAVEQSPPGVHGRSSPVFQHTATSLFDLFDLRFTRYVTPLIVKITWAIALAVSAVWLALLVFGMIVSVLPDIETSGSASARRLARPGALIDFWSSALNEHSIDAGQALASRLAIALTQIVGAVLLLLWLRAALESIIVIFHIAASLRSMDGKLTGRQ